jgi:ABC-type amino acid transport substrate-binding protein
MRHLPLHLKIASLIVFMAPAAMAQAPMTLDKVKSSGTITVSYRDSSIPFSYLDDKAQPTGFSWEICAKVIEAVKKSTGRAENADPGRHIGQPHPFVDERHHRH